MHASVGDGWGIATLVRELAELYDAFRDGRESPLPDLPVQYADYAVWQREQLQGATLQGQLAWWRERLAGAGELPGLPTDHPLPAVRTHEGADVPLALAEELVERLRTLARGEGATLYMVLLGAFQAVLGAWCGSDDVAVGAPVVVRTRPEVEELIGPFVNTVVLRTDLSGDLSFHELLRRVRDVALGAWRHQETPYERVMEALGRGPADPPLFAAMVSLHGAESAVCDFPGLRTHSIDPGSGSVRWDLTLSLDLEGRAVTGAVLYAAELFERPTIERLIAQYVHLLERIADRADEPISAVRS
jgi:hypothetical protein